MKVRGIMFVVGYISFCFGNFEIDDKIFENEQDAIVYRDELRNDGFTAEVYELKKVEKSS